MAGGTDAPTVMVEPGEVIGDKFQIERVVGEGGMGVVVAARHLQLGERVALKFLRREALGSPEIVARFHDEARATARLRSEHVARVLDVGAHKGAPFIVMEYLEGRDLGALLTERGRLAVTDAVEYVIQACAGLAEAHARDIVHSDVKPENLILVRRDGRPLVKIVDFGIARAAFSADAVVGSSPDVILGSPMYMAPEQLRSSWNVDHRADVWSLGAVLFELVAGIPPFEDAPLPKLVAAVTDGAPYRLRDVVPDAPDGLDAVIRRCLQKDRRRRFENVAELAIALLPFAPRRSRDEAARAASLAIASGLSEPNLALPPSEFPPAPSDSTFGPPPTTASVPAILTLRPSQGALETLPDETEVTERPRPSATSPASRAPRYAILAVAAGLALGAATTIFALHERSPTVSVPPIAPERMTAPLDMAAAEAPPTQTPPTPTAQALSPPASGARSSDAGTPLPAAKPAGRAVARPKSPRHEEAAPTPAGFKDIPY